MSTIPIGNTILFLSNNEVELLRREVEACCHAADLQGSPNVILPDLLSLTVTEARSLMRELSGEETVNWQRDGF